MKKISTLKSAANSHQFKHNTISYKYYKFIDKETNSATISLIYFAKGDTMGSNIFEFLATYTDVEWGHAKTGDSSRDGLNIIASSFLKNEENGIPNFVQSHNDIDYRELIHSHPKNTEIPSEAHLSSDGKIVGDIPFKAIILERIKKTTNDVVFKIYIPKKDKYIEY